MERSYDILWNNMNNAITYFLKNDEFDSKNYFSIKGCTRFHPSPNWMFFTVVILLFVIINLYLLLACFFYLFALLDYAKGGEYIPTSLSKKTTINT